MKKLSLHEVEDEEMTELPTFTKEQLEEHDEKEVQYEITVKEEEKARMKPNMAAIAEYKKKVRNILF